MSRGYAISAWLNIRALGGGHVTLATGIRIRKFGPASDAGSMNTADSLGPTFGSRIGRPFLQLGIFNSLTGAWIFGSPGDAISLARKHLSLNNRANQCEDLREVYR
jgi:hypothetical protein